MKSLRALTTLLLACSLVATGTLVAHAGTPIAKQPRPTRRVAPTAASIGAVAGVNTPATLPGAVSGIPSRVIVRLKGSATPTMLSALAHSTDTSSGTAKQLARGPVTWLVPPGRSAEKFAAQLEASGRVVYAVPDYDRMPAAYTPPEYVSPNDPDFNFARPGSSFFDNVLVANYPYGRSWWLRDIRAPEAWARGYTGSNIVGKYPLRASGTQITVAVIDSGLYANHPDSGVTVVGGHDFFEGQTSQGVLTEDDDVTPVSPLDVSASTYARKVLTVSHGTCVSGEIGATANNDVGNVGVGYDTKVVVHKVMGKQYKGPATIKDSAVYNAIVYSADHGANVINLSIGGYQYSALIADAIDYAYSKGCVIVAAKGNDASKIPYYPASNKHVVSVGALDKNARASTIPAFFSNYARTSMDIMAPGTFIWGMNRPDVNLVPSMTEDNGYYLWDGTSMSAPIVSGAIAWLWRAAPALSNAEITNEVLASAPKGPKSKKYPSGYRRLDMAAAYARLVADYPLLTKPALEPQTVASLGSVPVAWGVPLSNLRGVTYTWSAGPSESGRTLDSGKVFPWTSGDHWVSVQANSTYNWDDGTATSSAMVHIVPSTDGTTTWLGAHVAGSSASVTTPGYRVPVVVDAALYDASGTALSGATPMLQSAADGVNFADAPGAVVSNLPHGVYRATVSATARTSYRFVFAGSGGVIRSTSAAVIVIPGVSLSTPYSKSRISRTKHFRVSGKIMPTHSSSSRVVKLKIKRWNGHRWADYSSIWTRVTRVNSSYATYAVKLRLKKGGYRIYAFAVADGLHSATTSGYRAVTVR